MSLSEVRARKRFLKERTLRRPAQARPTCFPAQTHDILAAHPALHRRKVVLGSQIVIVGSICLAHRTLALPLPRTVPQAAWRTTSSSMAPSTRCRSSSTRASTSSSRRVLRAPRALPDRNTLQDNNAGLADLERQIRRDHRELGATNLASHRLGLLALRSGCHSPGSWRSATSSATPTSWRRQATDEHAPVGILKQAAKRDISYADVLDHARSLESAPGHAGALARSPFQKTLDSRDSKIPVVDRRRAGRTSTRYQVDRPRVGKRQHWR